MLSIDVYSANKVRENGHTSLIGNVSFTARENQIGDLSFVVPTAEYNRIEMSDRKWYYLYHSQMGFIGRFRQLEHTISEDEQETSVKCEDALGELVDVSLDFGMAASEEAV